jgi:predicted KAP-like P-loop ATPase
MSAELADTPLAYPEDDLLGVAPSAKILADRLALVQPPFTAGVYGEWGSGKTTFVSFVAEYLKRLSGGGASTLFISFSAWRYKTADEIWRALILTIARRISMFRTRQISRSSQPRRASICGTGLRPCSARTRWFCAPNGRCRMPSRDMTI